MDTRKVVLCVCAVFFLVHSCVTEKNEMQVTDVVIEPECCTLNVGDTLYLNVQIYPSYAYDRSLVWETSDSNVVKVSRGIVSAINQGEANVVVKTMSGVSDTMIVEVSNPDEIRQNVYVVGSCNGRAALWKNGELTYLSDKSSSADWIKFADNGTMYVVGYEIIENGGFDDGYSNAVVWINGEKQYLTDEGVASVTTVVSEGNDLYILGDIIKHNFKFRVCWKNFSAIRLHNSYKLTDIYDDGYNDPIVTETYYNVDMGDMAVNNGNVVMLGCIQDINYKYVPLIYRGGIVSVLPYRNGSICTYSIYCNGYGEYILGGEWTQEGYLKYILWENGTIREYIPDYDYENIDMSLGLQDIYEEGGIVYTCGWEYNIGASVQYPVLVVNEEIVRLPISNSYVGMANQVVVQDDKTYVVGYYRGSDSNLPAVWIDEELYTLSENGEAKSIWIE